VGTAVVTQGLGKDVEVADKAGVNAVENNFLTVRKQIQYANEMNTCGKDKSCLANTKNKYNAEYNMKKQLLTQAKQKCLNNPLCRWTRQKHIIYNNLQNNRLFDNEITKTSVAIISIFSLIILNSVNNEFPSLINRPNIRQQCHPSLPNSN
jgi:hypothetical protein